MNYNHDYALNYFIKEQKRENIMVDLMQERIRSLENKFRTRKGNTKTEERGGIDRTSLFYVQSLATFSHYKLQGLTE